MDGLDEALTELGLTALECKIYKTLLNQGPSLAGFISQKTGIHRRNVYDALERLIQKGLVGYVRENNKRVYSLTDPEKMLERLQEKEKMIAKAMPQILGVYHATKAKQETLFFRGKEGLKHIFEDQLQVGKEILVYATSVEVTQVLQYFFPKYQLVRKEKKIPTRMIFDEVHRTKKSSSDIQALPFCKVHYVKDLNKSSMSQYIYGDNVAIVVWKDQPIAIVIRQKEIAQGFKENFEVLWKLGKP